MADARTITEVRVDALTLDADIGVHAHEIGARQPLVVSVALTLGAPHVATLGETVDYRHIVAEATDLATRHVPLIESFAQMLAERCLALGAVTRAEVTVAKPRALDAGLASVRVIAQ